MADLKKFAEELVNLSVKEVNELAKILKDEYGIEPAAAAVAFAGPASGSDAPAVEEKSTFDGCVWRRPFMFPPISQLFRLAWTPP